MQFTSFPGRMQYLSNSMNLLLTIKSLYALNGCVAVLLYLPQIMSAWKDRSHALSLSLLTFGGWSAGSLISTLYAWMFVKDKMFAAISLGNLAGSGTIFLIVLSSRLSSRNYTIRRSRSSANQPCSSVNISSVVKPNCSR
jgi:PQ loop repeat protein